MRIAVLGCGRVGSAIVADLARDGAFEVTAVDGSREALERVALRVPAAERVRADLSDPGSFPPLLKEADLAVCAVPGFLGFQTLKAIVEAGMDVVDISFFAEDPFALDALARERGVTAVVDCGVAPGLCNAIAGYVSTQLDSVERYACYVGGLPQVRRRPYEYKAVFSPLDVLEEYTRPARLLQGGREVVRPALSDVEPFESPRVGTLEAFNTDGLRTLRHTLDVPHMVEKTLRYPGHAALMRVFRESGFFDPNPVVIDGQPVRPLSLTAKLLFEQWKLRDGEADLTVMRVELTGKRGERHLRHSYDLFDQYDPETDTTSMARTTGYTCTAAVRLLAEGRFQQAGICPPEYLGFDERCFQALRDHLAARGVALEETVTEL